MFERLRYRAPFASSLAISKDIPWYIESVMYWNQTYKPPLTTHFPTNKTSNTCPLVVTIMEDRPRSNHRFHHNTYCSTKTLTITVRINSLVLWEIIGLAQYMMTSSNGNIFRVTGPLCGEFTGPRWIPCTKASDAELRFFLWSEPE